MDQYKAPIRNGGGVLLAEASPGATSRVVIVVAIATQRKKRISRLLSISLGLILCESNFAWKKLPSLSIYARLSAVKETRKKWLRGPGRFTAESLKTAGWHLAPEIVTGWAIPAAAISV